MTHAMWIRLLIIIGNLLAWVPLFLFIRYTRRDLRWLSTPLIVVWLAAMCVYIGLWIADRPHLGVFYQMNGNMALVANLWLKKRYNIPNAHDLITLDLANSRDASPSVKSSS
jgi:hypothetical protein